MNKKKLVTTLGSLALVGAIGVGATLAYLTDSSTQVKNTFSLSEGVDIYLDEENVDLPEGTSDPQRDTQNTYKDIVYGIDYLKDPTVTITNSELEQYVFVAIEAGDDMDTKYFNNEDNLVTGIHSDWNELVGVENPKPGVKYYCYKDTNLSTVGTDKVTNDADLGYNVGVQLTPLFNKVSLKAGKDSEAQLNKEVQLDSIKIAAVTIQSEGFDSALDAFTKGNVQSTLDGLIDDQQ